MRGRPFLKGMSLDNRPKVLVVKGFDAQNPDSVQSVRTWYEVSHPELCYGTLLKFLAGEWGCRIV